MDVTRSPAMVIGVRGSLTRRSGRGADSVWTLRVDLPREKNGKRVQQAITVRGTKDEAEEVLARLVERAKKKKPGEEVRSDLTMSELFDLWTKEDSTRDRPRADSTKYHDQKRFENWVKPRFGDKVVDDITNTEVEDFYNSLRKDRPHPKNPRKRLKGLSPNSVVRVHALLAAMLTWGYRRKHISVNPMDHVDKPRGVSVPTRSPSVQEVKALLDYLIGTDPLLWLAVRLTCTLGLRRSELLALKYGDVVLDHSGEHLRGSVRIEKGVVRVPGKNHDFIQTLTKTGTPSHRTLGLDEELCAVFAELIASKEALLEQEKADSRMHWDLYIFTDELFGLDPWYPDTLSHKLAAARKEAGLMGGKRSQSRVPITFRSLRIYCASQAYTNDMDVRTAKAILGHASLATTDRWYLTFSEEKLRDATIMIGDQHRRPKIESST
jgi:integrase